MEYPNDFVNKLILGDCLDVMPLIPDKSCDMILCDLPYGITARNKWDVIIPLEPLFKQYCRIIKNNGVIALTAQGLFAAQLMISCAKYYRYDLIWEKDKTTGYLNAKRQPLRKHEQILIFYKKQPAYTPQFSEGHKPQNSSYHHSSGNNYNEFTRHSFDDKRTWRYPTSIMKINTVNNSGKEKVGHPTQKPVALFEYLIKTYTKEGEIVLDNCAGSGTTAIACQNTAREFICIEKTEKYFNIASKRVIDNHPLT